MDVANMEVVQVELKYCERCGGLWFRRLGCEEVYCASCELATGRGGPMYVRRRPRMPVNDASNIRRNTDNVVVYTEGGNA